MKSKRLCTVLLAVLAVAFAAGIPGAASANEIMQPCSIAGTWYGYNELGEVFVITITRTAARTYSAVGQGPADPAAFPGVYESFSTQGDLTRTRAGEYDSSWMALWTLDPDIWGDFELGNVTAAGPITMTSCDSWEATFTTQALGFHFGEDAFADGVVLDELGPYAASYRRIPQLPQ